MIKIFILLLFLGLFFVANKYDVGPQFFKNTFLETKNIIGPVTLENFKADALSVTGPLVGKDIVLKKLSCIGPVNLEKAIIEEFNLVGPADLMECKITDDSKIIGALSAKNSEFGKITITTSDIHLDNVKTKGVLVKHNSGSSEKQRMVLTGDAVVDGDIVFESGEGFLEKSESAQIKGSVKGCSVSINK